MTRESKENYIKSLAKMDWESGHPFSSDDFRYFKRCCKEDDYDMTEKDFAFYFECYDNCRSMNPDDDSYEVLGSTTSSEYGKVEIVYDDGRYLLCLDGDIEDSDDDYGVARDWAEEYGIKLKENCRKGSRKIKESGYTDIFDMDRAFMDVRNFIEAARDIGIVAKLEDAFEALQDGKIVCGEMLDEMDTFLTSHKDTKNKSAFYEAIQASRMFALHAELNYKEVISHPEALPVRESRGAKMKVAHTDMRMNESFKGMNKRRVKESRSFKENASDSDKIYIEVNCNTVTKNYPDFYKLDYMPDESVEAECDAFYREQVKALEAAGFEKGWTHVACDSESGPSEHDFDNAYEYWTGTVADLRAAADEGLDLESIRVYETVLDEPKESFNEEYGYPVLDFFDDEIVDVESLIWESNDYEPPIR